MNITLPRAVIEQALEALELAHPRFGVGTVMHANAITVLRERLAQPEQEPVAIETVYETIIRWAEGGGKRSRRELARRIVDLYTAPPQRKPLSDEEIQAIWKKTFEFGSSPNVFARAIEAAHGIMEEA